jgi:hypothetical protein
VLNILPASCLITSSDIEREEFIHISNKKKKKKRVFSFLSPEGENWAGIKEPEANFLDKRNVWVVVVCLFLAPSEKHNQLNAIERRVFKYAQALNYIVPSL